MFELKYIGHAGWQIKNKDFKCLCDPWFGPQGAYFGQWYPFPKNAHIFDLSLLDDLDFIYISHVHEDHYDQWFLKQAAQINKSIPIYISNFLDRTLYNGLVSLGFEHIIEVRNSETIRIKHIDIKIVKEESHLDSDSCILFEDDKYKILNLNDCHVDFSKLKDIAINVDALLLQATSAIWWPCAYDYSEEQMHTYGQLKRENNLNRALKYAAYLKAKVTVPNAGPPYFHDRKLDVWNYNRRESWNPFVLPDDACQHLRKNGQNAELVIPGSILKVSDAIENITNQDEKTNIYEDVDKYVTQYRDYLNDYALPKPQATAEEKKNAVILFVRQIKRIHKISRFYTKQIEGPIMFDLQEGKKWIVDFSKDNPIVEYTNEKYIYSFVIDFDSFGVLFKEKTIDFEKYFLGCNFSCSRNPDIYNEPLFALLKHFDYHRFLTSESLYGVRHRSSSKMFTMEHQGKKIKVQKYCPHMLADLEEIGYIDKEENFVCPLHGWKFDLSTGKCLNNENTCLKIEELTK